MATGLYEVFLEKHRKPKWKSRSAKFLLLKKIDIIKNKVELNRVIFQRFKYYEMCDCYHVKKQTGHFVGL